MLHCSNEGRFLTESLVPPKLRHRFQERYLFSKLISREVLCTNTDTLMRWLPAGTLFGSFDSYGNSPSSPTEESLGTINLEHPLEQSLVSDLTDSISCFQSSHHIQFPKQAPMATSDSRCKHSNHSSGKDECLRDGNSIHAQSPMRQNSSSCPSMFHMPLWWQIANIIILVAIYSKWKIQPNLSRVQT